MLITSAFLGVDSQGAVVLDTRVPLAILNSLPILPRVIRHRTQGDLLRHSLELSIRNTHTPRRINQNRPAIQMFRSSQKHPWRSRTNRKRQLLRRIFMPAMTSFSLGPLKVASLVAFCAMCSIFMRG